MPKRRYSKIQWGQTGRHRQAATLSGATPSREGGHPREPLLGHPFHAALDRTVLELERAETLARAFLIRRAKRGEAFAVRLLRERYRVRVATGAEVCLENQRRGLTARAAAGGTGVGLPEQRGPAVGVSEPWIAAGAVWAGSRGRKGVGAAAPEAQSAAIRRRPASSPLGPQRAPAAQ